MKNAVPVLLLGIFAASASSGQGGDIPVANWTVPPFTLSSGGITTMTDATPPRVFVGVQPCRLVDTRAGSGFPAGFGPPSLVAGTPRTFDLDDGPCPGLPIGIDAYSLNVTVTNPAGPGHLVIYPGGAAPTVSSINYTTGQTIANAVIVPAGVNGTISVVAGVSGTDLIIDINGYFSDTLGNPASNLRLVDSSMNPTIDADNQLTSCTSTCGIYAHAAGGTAIRGDADGSGGGVVRGIWGQTASTQAGSAGVYGLASQGTGTFGVFGESGAQSATAAGVRGHATDALSNGGMFDNGNGSPVFLATTISGVTYSVYGSDRIRAGSLDIVGAPKNFVAPHPTDPGLEIRYASAEAPTVDVYFRGTASLVNGIAHIEVPDHFRFTAREGTYMTTVTPLDSAVALRVADEGPDGIVVGGAGNTRFHYVVWAERAEIVAYEPVVKNVTFTPEALEKARGAGTLPEATRSLLMRNGTINPDGTYNLDTARTLGWRVPTRSREEK